MSHYVISLFSSIARDAFDEFCRKCASPKAYVEFLYQTYQYVRATVPTITAVVESRENHLLASYFRSCAHEEAGHDEMLLADIRLLGISPSGIVSPHIQALVELENSSAAAKDPISALLGHMLVMEGFAPSRLEVERLVDRFGVALDAAKTLLTHAELDVGHGSVARALSAHPSIDKVVVLEHSVQTCRLLAAHWRWMTSHCANVY